MEIKSLHLENVLSWASLDLNFEELSFALFIGKCGSGKTNIFDGLTWVLYDRTARPKYDKNKVIRDIPKRMEQALGDVSFIENGDLFEVTRMRGKRDDLIITKNNVALDLRNPTFAQEELERILGMTYSTFINIAYFAQGDAGKFLSATSTDRIKVISSVLCLEDYDKAAKLAGDRHKALTLQTEGERGQILTYESIVGEVDFKALNAEKKSKQNEFDVVIKDLKLKRLKLNNINFKLEKKSIINSLANEYKTEKNALKEFIDKTKNRISEAELSLDSEAKVKQRLSGLKNKIGEMVLIEKSLESQKQLIADGERELDILDLKFKSHMDRANEIAGAKVKLGHSCPTCHAKITSDTLSHINVEAGKFRKLGKTAEDLYNKNIEELDLKVVTEKRLIKELDKYKEVKRKHNELLGRLVEFGSIRGQLDKLQEELETDTKSNKEKLKVKKKIYDGLVKEYRTMYAKFDEKQFDEISEDVTKLDARDRELSSEIDQLKYRIGEYQKAIDALVKLKEQIEDTEAEMEMADFWKQTFPKLKLQVIAESIPVVEALTNDYLSDLLDGVSVELKVDPAKVTNRLDVIIKYDNGTRRIFEGWNGGAQLQMSTANFMALNRLASLRSGKSLNFLLLDEKFASLDSIARADILELLRRTYTNRKLFAISHVEGLEAEFDQVIRIESNGGVSEIVQA